ncbi:type IV pilin [Halomicrobium sp. HM KBTZ05]|uniref:type IV pilin n=1 Tax=Halomicrobium sp. HM KBTZ05 TaxID=3242663 RepID=UPI00355803EC
MGLRESWNELGTGGKIAVGLGVGGVVLVVALVVLVVLAAVLASFVLGVGSETAPETPTASFNFDYEQSAGQVQIQHAGGDSIPASEISIVSGGQRVFWADGGGAVSGDDGRVVAGDSITVDVEPGDDVRVVYKDGDTSATLSSFRAPDKGS